jgi:hypothetical protein
MTRVFSATFLVLYTAFTVVVSVEYTAATAATYARDSASSPKSIRSVSPRGSFVRIQEEPFVGLRMVTAFALDDTGSTVRKAASPDRSGDCRQFTPCRAPPALL